ncbi:MAG: ABC transporter ATP-binding protein [Chthoniobacterales bacterium]
MSALLQLDRLNKSYGAISVLRDFSLDVCSGENIALVGSSGCGKTTLLRLIAGLDTPQSGRVVIDRRAATEGPRIVLPPHRRGVAMVFQDLALWPNLTARENILLGLSGQELRRADAAKRTDEALTRCHAADFASRKPTALSGGQQQRVALARAFAVRPRLLLLDEPFTALDPSLAESLLAETAQLARSLSATVVLVSHRLDDARALSCRVIPVHMPA